MNAKPVRPLFKAALFFFVLICSGPSLSVFGALLVVFGLWKLSPTLTLILFVIFLVIRFKILIP